MLKIRTLVATLATLLATSLMPAFSASGARSFSQASP